MRKSKAPDCDAIPGAEPLLPVEQAIERILLHASVVNGIEPCELPQALGRVLAEDLVSDIHVPPSDNSAMDGYAFNYQDTRCARENNQAVSVSQTIYAGDIGEPLVAGTVARIFTGAAIPVGADTVQMQEYCEPITETQVHIGGNIRTGDNIRLAGEDISSGDIVLTRGSVLQAQQLGLAASVGVSALSVKRRLKVAVFFTGDELCDIGEQAKAGQIYNSNRYTLTALLRESGCDVLDLGRVKDSLEATRQAMLNVAGKVDLVITSGGVSVGDADYIRKALEDVGELNIWRINFKPGKPLAFGKIGDTLFMGLPGNPVSVFVSYLIMARPMIYKMQGRHAIMPTSYQIAANFDFQGGSRQEYLRVRRDTEGGMPVLIRHDYQGSGVLSSVSWANGVAVIPPDTEVKKGDLLEFIPFG